MKTTSDAEQYAVERLDAAQLAWLALALDAGYGAFAHMEGGLTRLGACRARV